MDLEVRAAGAQVEEARNAVIEAHAEGDDAKAAKLRKRLQAAEEDAKRLRDEKLVGVQRAQQRAEADRVTFVANNYAALLDERRPKAEEVARGVEEAIAAVAQAHAAWQAVEAEVMSLMRLAGKARDRTPELSAKLTSVVHDISRLEAGTVPAPIPGGTQYVRIDPTEDPDEQVRETARARFV